MTVESSIITPIYNAEEFLEDTLNSILNQTYQDWESILIDDNSTDNSLKIAEKFALLDSRFIIIYKTVSGGAAKARNAGIEKAKGRFIAFLDSDDIWESEKLEKQIAFMKSNEILFGYTNYHLMSEQGQVSNEVKVPLKVSYDSLLKGNVVACLTAIYDSKHLGKVLMPDIRKRQDFGLWLKITKRGVIGYSLQESLARYRIRSGSISHAKFNTMKYTWHLYRSVEKLSYFKSIGYLSSHLFGATLKRVKFWFANKN